jgi:hypothetical protein
VLLPFLPVKGLLCRQKSLSKEYSLTWLMWYPLFKG